MLFRSGHVAGPFSIDLQLVGDQGITVTVALITFGGGSPAGLPNCFGNCSGDLSTAVSMNAASGFLNEFYQTFTPGASLMFRVTFGNIVPPPVGGPSSPDAFSFAILDSTLSEIPMLAGNGSFLTVTLDNALTPSILVNSNDPSGTPAIGLIGAPAVAPSGVPEPAHTGVAGLVILLAAAYWRKRLFVA